MNYRMDYRSKSDFKKTIKLASQREAWLMDLWVEEISKRGYKITCRDFGVDNSGEYVDRANNNPDFAVTINGQPEQKIELKTNPVGNDKSTFKVESLHACVQHNAWILLFFEIQTKSAAFKETTDLSKVQWALIEPAAIRRLLLLPAKCYGQYIMGNKPSVMIFPDEYEKYWIMDSFKHVGKK